MNNDKVFQMNFGKIYGLLLDKATRKGRKKAEVDEIICWLTGYSQNELERMQNEPLAYAAFFQNASEITEKTKLVKGVVCGVRVEEVKEPLMRAIRCLDKLVDELAKGKSMEKILHR